MTRQLLVHNHTQVDIDQFLRKPAHALIIEGKPGSGKSALAKHLATKLLDANDEKLGNYPYLLQISPSGQSISIDDVRQAQDFLKLKTVGQSSIRRILIVEQAETMTIEAQNAFLKLLEEPPTDTVVLVLTSQKIKLLPTIRSRAQIINIKAINKTTIDNYFTAQGHDQADITKAYYASNAQVGLMTSLLTGDESSQQLKDLEQAKKVLAMPKLDRLAYVDELSKQKADIPSFIRALTTISQAALQQTVDKDNLSQAKRWHHSLKLSLEAEKKLSANPNPKLLLTDLLINL